MTLKKSAWLFLLILLIMGCEKQQHPPVCQLRATPKEGTQHTHFLFSVEDCSDAGNPVYALKFRWDMDNDGSWETGYELDREIGWTYAAAGTYIIRVEAIDPLGQTRILKNSVTVENRNDPPQPNLKLSMYKTSRSTQVTLDGSDTWDYEDPVENMFFRWDFESDGIWDTEFKDSPVILHRFEYPGKQTVTMQVMDTDSASATASKEVMVIDSHNEYNRLWDPRNNREYPVVKVGGLWWMAENLDYGELRTLNADLYDNDFTEMFVYHDIPENRTLYGGLYLWGEAMNYDTGERSAGVCPAGWHIPDDSEWKELERTLGIRAEDLDNVSPDRGDPAGTMLKIDGSSGFEAGLYGFIPIIRNFANFGVSTGFWSSSGDSTGVWVRTIKINSGGIQRSRQPNNFAFAVRCVKDD